MWYWKTICKAQFSSFPYLILVSIVVSIPACHAGDRGSIPRRGDFFLAQDEYWIFFKTHWPSTKIAQERGKSAQIFTWYLIRARILGNSAGHFKKLSRCFSTKLAQFPGIATLCLAPQKECQNICTPTRTKICWKIIDFLFRLTVLILSPSVQNISRNSEQTKTERTTM